VVGEAARRIDLWKLDPARRDEVEAQVRREHDEALAVRTLAGVPVEDYAAAVNGDAGRDAFMYVTADTLPHGTSAPDVITDVCISITEDRLSTTAAIP
jgi:hypothetical protein